MPTWLHTSGNALIAIFICGRCKMKRAIVDALPDPNFPGLQVCNRGCADQKDPYRLPARQTERISLRFPRPDASVAVSAENLLLPDNLVLSPYGGAILATEQGTGTVVTGNSGLLSPPP